MSGFHSNEQIDAYKAALGRERDGYEAAAAAAKVDGDKAAEAKAKNRIAQVEAELKRVEKLDVEDPAAAEDDPSE